MLEKCKIISARLISEVEYQDNNKVVPQVSVDAFRVVSRVLALPLDHQEKINFLLLSNRLIDGREYNTGKPVPQVAKDCSAMLGKIAYQESFREMANDFLI